jgi:hypothetical protein
MFEDEAGSADCAELLLTPLGRDRCIALTMIAHTGEAMGQA